VSVYLVTLRHNPQMKFPQCGWQMIKQEVMQTTSSPSNALMRASTTLFYAPKKCLLLLNTAMNS